MSYITGYFRNIVGGFINPCRAVVKNWSLYIMLLRRDLINRTSGTILGKVWLLVGMLPWLCVAEVISRSTSMFREFAPLYRRNPFPLELLPVLVMTIPCLVYGSAYFVLNLVIGGIDKALLSLFVLPMFMLWLIPLCLLFPVLGLFIKDFGQAIPFLLMITLFLTPILYFPSMLPQGISRIIWINPFSDLMAVVHGVLQDSEYNWLNVARPMIIWLLLLGPCWLVYKRSIPHVREVL